MHENTQKTKSLKIDVWLFIFSMNYAFWHLIVAFLNFEIKYKLMVAELFDLATPFVMTFLILKLCCILRIPIEKKRITSIAGLGLIILGIIFFIEGHGMHLSANAITRHLVGQEGSPVFRLTYFFDEILGHLLWDGGFIIISIALILLASVDKNRESNNSWLLITICSLLYGFTYFCLAIEGQTVLLTLPCSVLIPVVIWIVPNFRQNVRNHPIVRFYLLSYIFAFCLFVYWAIRFHAFPQFSELGWI